MTARGDAGGFVPERVGKVSSSKDKRPVSLRVSREPHAKGHSLPPVKGEKPGSGARCAGVFASLTLLLVALLVANLCLGSVGIPVGTLVHALRHPEATDTAAQVVWGIRLPRLIAAAVLGGALALAGFLLQTFFANPIAGPYILGIASGAKLAVAATMICVLGTLGVARSWMLVLAAFVGSLAVTGLVITLSHRVRQAGTLIVVGVMVGYLCSAATDFLTTFASDASIASLRGWSLGSFSGTDWNDVRTIVATVTPASIGAFLLSKPMGAYQLGEGYARSVGVRIPLFRATVVALSSLLAGCVTAFAGPISFVGIAVPHIAKRLLATARPIVVIPATLLAGADFCLLCDLIARMAFAPTELSVSTVTALFGAPVVIGVLLGRRRDGSA